MRGIAVACAFLLSLAPAHFAEAVFYNDSQVIEIGDGTPPAPSESDPGGGEEEGGSAGNPSDGESGSENPPPGGASEGSGGDSSDSGSGGSSNGFSGGSGGSSGSSGSTSGDDIIDFLVGEGALGGIEAPGGVSGGEDEGGTLGSSSSLSAGTTLVIDGSKVRSALRERYDMQEALSFLGSLRGKKTFTAREYGLMAVSTAARDGNIERVSFTAGAFEIVYRSRGYLFSVFPLSFPVRVTVVPGASTLEERVQVKLPWYRFFVREFFTAAGLASDIDGVVTTTRESSQAEAGSDITPEIYDAVWDFLRRKVGTISESLLRGS